MMPNRDPERGNGKNRNHTYHAGAYYAPSYDKDYSDSQWTSWLVPLIVVANVAMFVVIMFVNNCPRNNTGLQGRCVARFLGRLSFQPTRENPLFGPSASTYVVKNPFFLPFLFSELMVMLKLCQLVQFWCF